MSQDNQSPSHSYRNSQGGYYPSENTSAQGGYQDQSSQAGYHQPNPSGQQYAHVPSQPQAHSGYYSASQYSSVPGEAYIQHAYSATPSQGAYAQQGQQGGYQQGYTYPGHGYATYAQSAPYRSPPDQSAQYDSTSSTYPDAHGGRSIICDLCGRVFSRRHDMQRHKDTHHGDSVHNCPYCGKGYARADTLKRHIDTPCALAPPKKDDHHDDRSRRGGGRAPGMANYERRPQLGGITSITLPQEAPPKRVVPLQEGSDALPAAPVSLHGRVEEMRRAVELVLRRRPVPVAILGSWGIGKTHLALKVMHTLGVAELYGPYRFFVSCEEIHTTEALVEHLMMTFNLSHDSVNGTSPHDMLIAYLLRYPKILLCLDGLDLAWGADREVIEAFLYKLTTEIKRLALIVTIRGIIRPGRVAWKEPLTPLAPLTDDETLKIWGDTHSTHDSHTLKLLADMGGVPLPVTILAHLAKHESSERLYMRWQHDRTSMLRMPGGPPRLTSVDASIEVTLRGPCLKGNTHAVQALSLICTLPQGLHRDHIFTFSEGAAGVIVDFASSISQLEACGLIPTAAENDEFISPGALLRGHVLARYPLADALYDCLLDNYILSLDTHPDDPTERQLHLHNIYRESENILFIFRLALSMNRETLLLERALLSIASFLQLNQEAPLTDTALLAEAIACARRNHFTSAEAHLLRAHGQCLFRVQGCTDEVLSVFTSSLELHRRLGNAVEISKCLLSIGGLHRQIGRVYDAEHMLSSALKAIRDVGNREDEAYALFGLGCVYSQLGVLDEAEKMLQSALDLKGVINPSVDLMENVVTLLDSLREIRQRQLKFGQMSPSDIGTSPHSSGDDSSPSSTRSNDSSLSVSTKVRARRRRRRPSVEPLNPRGRHPYRDADSDHDGSENTFSVLKYVMVDPGLALEVIERVSGLFLPHASSPQAQNTYVSTIFAILGRFTCYPRLRAAEDNVNDENETQFDTIRKELLKEWIIIVAALAAITAIGCAGIVAAPDNLVPVGAAALLCLSLSASTAALGFVVCVVLLIQSWNIDAKRFRKLALGVYEDYCFFAIMAATPALSLLVSGLFVALFVLIAALGKWPAPVATLLIVFIILVFMQYIIKGGALLFILVRRGWKAALDFVLSLTQALKSKLVLIRTTLTPPSA